MSKIPIDEYWTFWYFRELNIKGFIDELEALERLIQMEKEEPYKGERWLREAVKKKIILQLKIKSLESGVENGR
jgi:hypothetical protein